MKSDAIINAVQCVTKKWAKQRKLEERTRSASINRRYAMTRSNHTSIKEAAWQIMERAYLKASANGTLPAHARQIMYAARGHIQRVADRDLGHGFDKYFTQTLLPDYIEQCGVAWNVVFDARGHFVEPHTQKEVPLGTLQVRSYLRRMDAHWHKLALPVIGTVEFGVTWGDFRRGWAAVKTPFGSVLNRILEEIDVNEKIPASLLSLG